ncbi:MAG: DUF3987 domain-containing protein, partial [Proteobacteria bacterium]|nr:DUF3987 domain-containing protein [Pseudomonadota bacterium]
MGRDAADVLTGDGIEALRRLIDEAPEIDGAQQPANEAGTGWPDLIPLDAPPLPALNPELLPSWLGDMARSVAVATETPPELAGAFGLAAVAAAVQRVYCVRPEPGYFEPLNVWLLCALEPGNRKTAVQGAMTAP